MLFLLLLLGYFMLYLHLTTFTATGGGGITLIFLYSYSQVPVRSLKTTGKKKTKKNSETSYEAEGYRAEKPGRTGLWLYMNSNYLKLLLFLIHINHAVWEKGTLIKSFLIKRENYF